MSATERLKWKREDWINHLLTTTTKINSGFSADNKDGMELAYRLCWSDLNEVDKVIKKDVLLKGVKIWI